MFHLVTHNGVAFSIFPLGNNIIPEALSWFAESKVHAVVSLLVWVYVSASLKLILNRHLGPINRRLVSPIKLGSAVHDGVHVGLVIMLLQRTRVSKHYAPG